MANANRNKSRSGAPKKSTTSRAAKQSGKSSSGRAPDKLDDVSDAPESGEPREQGRTRGHVIDRSVETGGSRADRASAPSRGSAARKGASGARTTRSTPKGPRAAAKRDQSGDTQNEAWESGRQDAVPEE